MINYQPKILERTQFGNPLLANVAKRLTVAEIRSAKIQALIADISYTLKKKQYGVGLAAPQVGMSVAISVIGIRPRVHRPDVKPFDRVIINPEVTETFGKKEPMWEGCLSMGAKNSPVFAQAMRYRKIKATFHDETGKLHNIILEGLPAHVFQHETDHLNGILFPERVKDHTTWMNLSEYKKMIKAQKKTETA